MKYKALSFGICLSLFVFVLAPTVITPVFAQDATRLPTDKPVDARDEQNKPSISIKINNPLCSKKDSPDCVDTIQKAIKKMMDIVLTLALPFIILFFIYSGYLFVTAQGDPGKLKKAKQMFINTLIGTLLILGSWTIATAIVNTVNEITG